MSELHLRVFDQKSELVFPDGTVEIFCEGKMTDDAKARYDKIVNILENNYLENQIILCQNHASSLDLSQLQNHHIHWVDSLVSSVTSEVGRALVGITVLQMCIKSIEPNQNIRLHKGSNSSRDFSWVDGISMRSLDKRYITPTLRKYELLKLNADGFMMTRSLAENYPYSTVYKANIKGARREWMNLVEGLENQEIAPEQCLHYLLLQLLNQAQKFRILASEVLVTLQSKLNRISEINQNSVIEIIGQHIENSNYAARLMEIAMHSLIQVMQEYDLLAGQTLKPLSQMRSANKKQGNIGDIELLKNKQIVEAWDAKYGKEYLRDELEELADKLEQHPTVEIAGFVTSVEPIRLDELQSRSQEIADEFGITLKIVTFEVWVTEIFNRVLSDFHLRESDLAIAWITAYTESLAQKRRQVAPIDEPCYQWLATWKQILDQD